MKTTNENKKAIVKVVKILLIIVIWPLYLILIVHKNEKIEKSAKKVLYIILAIVSLLWMVICLALCQGDKPTDTNDITPKNTPAVTDTATTETDNQTELFTEPVKTEPVKTEPIKTESVTDSQEEIITEEMPAETKEPKKPTNFYIPNGKLLSVIEGGLSGDVLVIKVKIESQFSNIQTINQNYENIEEIIRSDMYKEYYHDTVKSIDYWAVADMTDGSEGKVISFTVSENTINNVLNNEHFNPASYDEYEEYVQDLWILPSLTK